MKLTDVTTDVTLRGLNVLVQGAVSLALCSAAPFAAAQVSGGAALVGKLLVVGSGTMTPLIQDVAGRFQARHPGVRVDVQGGGSGRGINDARQGQADIGMVSRVLGDKDKDLVAFPIARDGVALIVHRQNRVKALSEAQLRDIFLGKIASWSVVGGRDAPIRLLERAGQRSSTEVLADYLDVRRTDVQGEPTAVDNADLIGKVAADPDAIAYVSVGHAERSVLAGTAIRLLPVAGVEASARTILSGDYPIARPLTLVTHGTPAPLARAFIDFALSPHVADLIRSHDFVSYQD